MSETKVPTFVSQSTDTPLRTGTFWSLYGVWFRHYRVYCRTLLANATPPVLEALFFYLAMTIGLYSMIKAQVWDGLDYRSYVASGMAIATAMFTGVFETTFGTFVRITWQKTYDAMLSTHLRVREVFVGELLFCATKGFVFTMLVIAMMTAFGANFRWTCLLVPVVGFVTAYLFGAIGLIVTSYVKLINNFAFFTTGVITPLFFFSGTFFPIKEHGGIVMAIWFATPLSHSVELSRALYKGQADMMIFAHLGMLVAYLAVAHWFALRRMRSRVLG